MIASQGERSPATAGPAIAPPVRRATHAGSRGSRTAGTPNSLPIRSSISSSVGWRGKFLWAFTWSRGSPLSANAWNCARISASSWRRTAGRAKKRTPSRTMLLPNLPWESTSAGMLRCGNTDHPSASTRCRPTARSGKSRARLTASSTAGAPTIRLAVVNTPSRAASSTALFTAACSPKSSAVTMRNFNARPAGRSGLVRVQEAEEFHALAQPPLGHLPAAQHLAGELGDLARPEVELLIEGLHRVIDLLRRQVRIADGGELHAAVVHQIQVVVRRDPAVVDRLSVELRA